MGRCSATPCTQWSMRAWRMAMHMVEMVEAHAWTIYICCTMVYSNHLHRFACSVVLELGSRAPIAIEWPAAVLVIWPHFNGNAQRRAPTQRHGQFGPGLALFSSRICWFLCTSNGYPRGKSNRPTGCPKIPGQIPCFLVGCHLRFIGLLACRCNIQRCSKSKVFESKVF